MTNYYVDVIDPFGDCHSSPTPDGLTFEDAVVSAKVALKTDISNGVYEGEDLSRFRCEVVAFDEPGNPRIVAKMFLSELV